MGRFPVRTEADVALDRNAPQNVAEGRFPKQGAEHDERQVVHPQGGVEARGVERAFAVHREHPFGADAEGEAHGRARAGEGRVFRDASVHAGDLDLLRIRKAGVDPCEIGVPEDEVRAFHHERRFGRKVFWVRVRPAQPVHPVDAPGLVAADAQVQAVEFHLVQTDAPLGQRKVFQGGLPPAEPAHNGPFRGGDFRILDLERTGQAALHPPQMRLRQGEEHVERHRAAVQVQGREIGQVAFEMLHVQRSRVDGEGGAERFGIGLGAAFHVAARAVDQRGERGCKREVRRAQERDMKVHVADRVDHADRAGAEQDGSAFQIKIAQGEKRGIGGGVGLTRSGQQF